MRNARGRHLSTAGPDDRTRPRRFSNVPSPSRVVHARATAAVAVLVSAVPALARAQAAAPAHSGLAYLTTHAESAAVLRFVDELQAAVARGDRAAVAAMVRYPAAVWDGRRTRRVGSSAALLRLYPRVFTPALRRDIAAVTVDSLFANYQGVMFAGGRVWFYPDTAGPTRVITINPPVPPPRASERRRPGESQP